jgi:hypothetical protein
MRNVTIKDIKGKIIQEIRTRQNNYHITEPSNRIHIIDDRVSLFLPDQSNDHVRDFNNTSLSLV